MAPSKMAFSFPLLKDNEIIECVNNMSIPLTQAELRQPNFQVLRTIFTNAAEFLMGVTADEINQPKFSGTDELSFPGLHEESVPRLQLFRTASTLLEACGCHQFIFQDLFKPTYEKLRMYLSAIINLAKFREDQLDVYASKTELQEQLASELETKTASNSETTKKIEEINEQHEKDMPVIIELQEQKKHLKDVLQERNQQQKKMMQEKDQLKQEQAAVADKDASVQYQIQKLEGDIDSLSENVVQSPDRLKAEITEIDRRFEDETSALKELEAQKAAELAKERARLDTIKQLKKTMEHMQTLARQQKKMKEASKSMKANRSKITQLNAEITEQEALHEHYIHRSNTCGKRQEAVDHQATDRTQIETLQKEQVEYETLQVAHDAGKEELQGIFRELDNIRGQIEQDRQTHKQRMKAQYDRMEKVVENFNAVNNNLIMQLQ